MTWRHVLDALIFIGGMVAAFGVAIWVENRSQAYSRDFDRHCRTAGVKDRRSLLPGRWSS